MKQFNYANWYAEKIQFWANQLLNDKYSRKYVLNKIKFYTSKELKRIEDNEILDDILRILRKKMKKSI